MTKGTTCKVQLRPLGLDYNSIRTAAEIVSLAFAYDPLIRWISRDRTGPGWESLPPPLQLWQEARLRGYAVRAIAMEAVTVDKSQPVGSCFLFPPSPKKRWLNPLWWPAYLRVLWDEWWVQPNETLGDEKRIELMMEAHEEFQNRMRKKYPPNSLYYLEIAAVKPDTQGMGVGKAIMEWVISEVGNFPCFLECTDKKNVGFYEKFGFRLVKETKLVQEGDGAFSTTFYYMVRDKEE
ncbi:uncharacterized protein B0J16DRAFT_417789 [Fusarium flagelliforme]|uniref:uncharacterized protein n=1 Tax=Fusarium flagelliforme TaxID=2675880 RepID=UPI001E8CB06B|nr:uncharacterized protein B0J16DRAFT_417789 [Fusarium flagelliforme]KAH7174251.1 hypothetical protein B0J16DRAFT_417789 [Fusarium flagelliforme]